MGSGQANWARVGDIGGRTRGPAGHSSCSKPAHQESGSLRLGDALLRSHQGDGAHLGMDEDFHRIGRDRIGRGRDIGDAVGQAAGRGQWIGKVAICVVGDAAAGVPVPGAGADVAGGRNVDQLVVGGAVGVLIWQVTEPLCPCRCTRRVPELAGLAIRPAKCRWSAAGE